MELVQSTILDDVFDRMGVGAYQKYMFVVLGLVYLSYGAEFVLFALMPQVLKAEWDLDDA